MGKDNYNIDEILSEVKKRKSSSSDEEAQINTKNVEKDKKAPAPQPEPKAEPTVEPEPEVEPKVEEQPVEPQPAPEVEPEVELNGIVVDDNDEEEEESVPAEDIAEQQEENQPDEADEAEEPAEADETQPTDESEGEMFNILDATDDKIEAQGADGKTEKPKKKHIVLKKILIALLALIIVVAVVGGVYVHDLVDSISSTNTNDSDNTLIQTEWTGMDDLVENFPTIQETDASQLSSLQDMIKTWYYNGEPCSSSHVYNLLLVGEDTRSTEISDDDSRADAAIICSVNVDTEEITLTSILRDTYAYWETTPGDESTGQFGKINGAMSTGDINAYINCVEKLYKVDIDNYVIVNFNSFKEIVDILGGVTLELTSAEINEINNHPKRYGDVYIEKTFDGNSGEVELTGEQALAYCRIRKLDSDNKRADRQKTFLSVMLDKIKEESSTKLIKIALKLADPEYISTGLTTSQIEKMGLYALSNGWLKYDIIMNTVPNYRINEKGAGGTYYGAWCWKSDFPQDAYNLQVLLYGDNEDGTHKSNITLAQERVDIINCTETGFYSDGNAAVWATIYNEYYGENSTVTTSKQDDD